MSNFNLFIICNWLLISGIEFSNADCSIDLQMRKCVKIEECEEYNLIIKSKSPNAREILQKFSCGFDRNTPLVCCPTTKDDSDSFIQLDSIYDIPQSDSNIFIEVESDCETDLKEPGICVVLDDCPFYKEMLLAIENKRLIFGMLKDLSCGFEGMNHKVCCSLPENVATKKINESKHIFDSEDLSKKESHNKTTSNVSNNTTELTSAEISNVFESMKNQFTSETSTKKDSEYEKNPVNQKTNVNEKLRIESTTNYASTDNNDISKLFLTSSELQDIFKQPEKNEIETSTNKIKPTDQNIIVLNENVISLIESVFSDSIIDSKNENKVISVESTTDYTFAVDNDVSKLFLTSSELENIFKKP